MIRLLATVSAATGLGLLLASGVSHGARPAAFRAALARQALWPRVLVAPVAAAVTLSELAVGGAGLLAVGLPASAGLPAWLRVAAPAAAAAIYALFAAYGATLLRRRPDAPCGCSAAADDDRVNAWVPLRAAVLAAGCGWAAASPGLVLPWSATTEALVAALASGAFVTLAWAFPAALRTPDAGRLEAIGRDRTREGNRPWTSTPAR